MGEHSYLEYDSVMAPENVRKVKLGADAMKRIAAGAHPPTPWLFEPAKRPDNRANNCLDSFLNLSEVGRAFWANSGDGSAQGAFPANWAT